MQQKPSTPLPTSIIPQKQQFPNFDEKSTSQDMDLVIHLLHLGQSLCEQTQDSVSRLCQEVKLITQERAQLHLGRQHTLKRVKLPSSTLATLPVQFRHRIYGILCIAADTQHPTELAIHLPIAQLIALVCSWLLYSYDQAVFLQGQC